jgi:hypothetical protein
MLRPPMSKVTLWDETVYGSPPYDPTARKQHSKLFVNSGVAAVALISTTYVCPKGLHRGVQW